MAPAGLLQLQVQSSYKPNMGFPSQFCQQLQEYPSEGVASHGRNGANWEAVRAILTVAILLHQAPGGLNCLSPLHQMLGDQICKRRR